MGDEGAFQAAIDANLADMTPRLVFADWLEEQGDPRAEGYRVLGQLGKHPNYRAPSILGWHYWAGGQTDYPTSCHLDIHWWCKFAGKASFVHAPYTRKQVDDLAALAWLELTNEERAYILEGVTCAADS